jgi:hypothetical protein
VSPLDGVNGVRRNLLARIGLSAGCRVSGARGRSGSDALSLSTHNSPWASVHNVGQMIEHIRPADFVSRAQLRGWKLFMR